MGKLSKKFGAPLILGGLTVAVAGAWTIATYVVDEDTLGLPLTILLQVAYIAAIAGAFALIRMRFGKLEGTPSGKRLGRPGGKSALEPAVKRPETEG